ncbi:hypothetical protein QV08_04785 [Gallibacterium salpingitidis]|uniref:Uncharacterized protein n=1 Tax=Gallibacterium salpingitidis TaxID=505341 RepID=A0AB36E6F4_9PAST|nr:hypothetical protein [Gallibacterium salpingitidis]OBX08523.1 hypothetical protein QV08_04785 [Gallibacterium salpingitidis]OBX11621.1 hypothetical protein QV09_01820 [Gallibacterium salpingitidis]
MTEQPNEFNTKKQHYLTEKQVLDDLIKEKEKIINIIAALEQDLIEQATATKEKLNVDNFLSADDYVALKQVESGIKTRIEYYNAYKEEIETKIYQQKEALYIEFSHLSAIRKNKLSNEFQSLLDSFSIKQKDILSKLYLLLKASGKITANSELDGYKGSLEYAVKEYLSQHLMSLIDTEMTLEDEFTLPIFIHRTELKTAAQRHLENIEKPISGFQKLIKNTIKG